MASRHLSRALVLQTLFECDLSGGITADRATEVLLRNAHEFALGPSDRAFAESLLAGVIAKQAEIDRIIAAAAPQWPIEHIAPIDRNVLRIGLFELIFGDRTTVPPKVALNEAIEVAKSFGGDSSGKFVNGVLGAVYRDIGEPQKSDASKRAESIPDEFLGGALVLAGAGKDAQIALVHDAFNRWTLPKSKCADGELAADAAARAIRNELGIEAPQLVAVHEHQYTAHEPRGAVRRTVDYFVGRVASAAPLACRECAGITAVQWFLLADLADLPMYDDVRAIVTAVSHNDTPL